MPQVELEGRCRTEELDRTIVKAAVAFDSQFRTTYMGVYPWGVVSKSWRWDEAGVRE
jgi:hypothetical protein